MFFRAKQAIGVLAIFVSGCASLSGPSPTVALGIDGEPCVGTVPAAVDGLNTSDNAALLAKAQYPGGKGGVCAAQAFAVVTPLNVYRVYDASKRGSEYGGWWAMARPSGPKEAYREKNAICKEWSNLDRLIACQVKVGAEIVLGTTQSVSCDDGTAYPKTVEIQVYVPNDSRNGVLYVESCREQGAWPAP